MTSIPRETGTSCKGWPRLMDLAKCQHTTDENHRFEHFCVEVVELLSKLFIVFQHQTLQEKTHSKTSSPMGLWILWILNDSCKHFWGVGGVGCLLEHPGLAYHHTTAWKAAGVRPHRALVGLMGTMAPEPVNLEDTCCYPLAISRHSQHM